MSRELTDLIEILNVDEIDSGLYKGRSQDLGFPALYGGHVLGQAVAAAQKTVKTEQRIHSLHSYFLLPGDSHKPVIYQIDNVRDGKSFSTRRVKAIQGGREIFILIASFQYPESGFDHQTQAPKVPKPGENNFPTEHLRRANSRQEAASAKGIAPNGFEFRPLAIYDWGNPTPREGNFAAWIKAKGDLPDIPQLHNSLLAYASDYNFLATSLMPHGASFLKGKLQIATIDHSVWLHRPIKFDSWLLFDISSPSASNGRGLVKGHLYDQEGTLIATMVQEGVIRQLAS